MKVKKKTDLTESAISYMGNQWGFVNGEGGYDDLQSFWDQGFYGLVAHRLVGAGAVENLDSDCDNILKFTENYTFKDEEKDVDEALQDYKTLSCAKCNNVHFLEISDDDLTKCCSCSADMTGIKAVNWKDLGKD